MHTFHDFNTDLTNSSDEIFNTDIQVNSGSSYGYCVTTYRWSYWNQNNLKDLQGASV